MGSVPAWRRYLRFWQPDVRADVDDELRFHLDARVADLVARGIGSDDARRQAEQEFGDVPAVRRALTEIDSRMLARRRRTQLRDLITHDLRYTLRGLRRDAGFTTLVVATLALGVGANSALFSFLDRLLLRPPGGVADPDGVRHLYLNVRTFGTGERFITSTFHYPGYVEIKRALPEGSLAAPFAGGPVRLGGDETAPSSRSVQFGEDYFRLLGARVALGRLPAPEEIAVEGPAKIALVSHAEWRRRFGGDSAILGRAIDIGFAQYTVIGVLAPSFHGTDVQPAHYWIPLGTAARPGRVPWYADPNMRPVRVLLRPARGTEARLPEVATAAYRRSRPESDTSSLAVIGPLHEALGPDERTPITSIAIRLGGVASIVLLIACANVANLLLARSMRRRREIAVQLALGVSRKRLVGLAMLESIVLAIAACIAALVIAAWGGEALRNLLMPNVPWERGALDVRVALFAFAVAVVTGVIASAIPAMRVGRFGLVEALRGGARDGAYQRSRARSVLLVLQAALSVVLLVGAGVFIRSLRDVLAVPTGWDIDHLITAEIRFDDGQVHQEDKRALYPMVMERLGSVAGVERAALSGATPFRMHGMVGLTFGDGRPVEMTTFESSASYFPISPGYFATTGVRLLAGRDFSDADRRESERVMIVNETMARTLWPGQDPLGQCLRMGDATFPCTTVIGVAAPVHRDGIVETTRFMQYYVPITQSRPIGETAVIRARPDQLALVGERVRTVMREILPANAYPVVVPLAETFTGELRPWRLGAALFSVFGALALIVAAIGIYSTISYTVSQRLHEMGIRIALGARAGSLIGLVMGNGVRIVLVGVLFGLLLVAVLGRLIESLLYETAPHDPVVMVAVGMTLVAVAALASLVPAWRATRVDPIDVLRAE